MIHRTAVAPWVTAAVLVALLSAAWSLAVPLMASPDEPSHVIKAAAVARGQWSGELGPDPTDSSRPGAATVVQVPTDYREAAALPNCFAFDSDQPASCQQDVARAAGGLVPTETFAGQYPPLYYVLVGWPSLFLGAEAGTYAMRLLSGALTAFFLTWAAYRVHREIGPVALGGVVVAVTPMVLFLGATVNPQALEIASAVSFWAATLTAAMARGGPSTGALVQAAVSGAVLINTRTSSPFWALVVVAVALLAAPPGRWREIIRHRSAPVIGVAAALAAGMAVGWVLTHPSQVTGGNLYPRYGDRAFFLLEATGEGWGYLTNMVGNFGWLDAPAPPLTVAAWLLAVGAITVLGLSVPVAVRARVALLLLVAVVAVAPIALQLPAAVNAGLIWQGRYALPIAVGVPLLAAVLAASAGPLATSPESDPRHGALTDIGVLELLLRSIRVLSAVVLVGHVAAFYWGSRRYSEGLDGDTLTLAPDWSSPIGFLPGVLVYALVAAALTALVVGAVRSPGPRPTDDVRHRDVATAP